MAGLVLWALLAGGHAFAQGGSGITSPGSGETLTGVVTITGTAVHPDYLRHELAFLQEAQPDVGWILFAEGSVPVLEGTLAVWDTTVGRSIDAPVFPDGRYQLRLRVVKTDYNYDEYYVTGIIISNSGPTPAPTTEATAVLPVAAGDDGAATGSFQQPTPLPSLTPFPTPTPLATAVGGGEPGEAASVSGGAGGGVLANLAAVPADRLVRAFWQGAVGSGALFGALALYLMMRGVFRRVWRYLWHRLTR